METGRFVVSSLFECSHQFRQFYVSFETFARCQVCLFCGLLLLATYIFALFIIIKIIIIIILYIKIILIIVNKIERLIHHGDNKSE